MAACIAAGAGRGCSGSAAVAVAAVDSGTDRACASLWVGTGRLRTAVAGRMGRLASADHVAAVAAAGRHPVGVDQSTNQMARQTRTCSCASARATRDCVRAYAGAAEDQNQVRRESEAEKTGSSAVGAD